MSDWSPPPSEPGSAPPPPPPPPSPGTPAGYGTQAPPGYNQGYGQQTPPGTPYPQVVAGPQWPDVPTIPDERTWGMLSHLSIFVLGIIGPAVIMATKGSESRFVRDQAVEALNFQICVAIAWVVVFILSFLIVGLLLIPVVAIGSIVLGIMGAMEANKGNAYRYPVNLRMVK